MAIASRTAGKGTSSGRVRGRVDRDGDGLEDGAELTGGTDPLVADTDGGGDNDGTEAQRGTNPLDPNDDSAPSSTRTYTYVLLVVILIFAALAFLFQMMAWRKGRKPKGGAPTKGPTEGELSPPADEL